jgi:hypothetical protein
MRVIRTMKPKTAAGGAAASAPAPAPRKPHSPDPQQPAEEGAPVPGPERGSEAEEAGRPDEAETRQEEPEDGPGDEDLVPDE